MRTVGVLKAVGKVMLIVAIVGGIFFFAFYHRYTQTGVYRGEYEGRVLDKWVNVVESQLGSGPQWRMLVESDGGERFEVAVSGGTYERARPGMRIRRAGGEVELWWPDSSKVPAAEGRK